MDTHRFPSAEESNIPTVQSLSPCLRPFRLCVLLRQRHRLSRQKSCCQIERSRSHRERTTLAIIGSSPSITHAFVRPANTDWRRPDTVYSLGNLPMGIYISMDIPPLEHSRSRNRRRSRCCERSSPSELAAFEVHRKNSPPHFKALRGGSRKRGNPSELAVQIC